MLNFNIRFIDGQNFEFLDLSDYVGLTNVSSTELRIYASNPISTETFDTIPLFNDPLTVLGDDLLVDLTTAVTDLVVLYDNIYQIDLYVTSDEGETFVTGYFAKTVDLLACRRTLVRNLVNTPVGSVYCKACEANYFDAALQTIDDYLTADSYKEAELLIADLKDTCKICDC